ncbi:hypothetical protein [Chitinasiproducens palmae]|uniref:Uncharacterized protein n=1 Tax=Chitinasiproducens palmae TaxID=1770053 RepID=A0A1H2PTT2_9BURK|nr:hypothetical protein [Chitinasiproducens palmae]SDV50531.1 hypothetical protein SAMN05216551_11264 [Chitinasiproducens palmae]
MAHTWQFFRAGGVDQVVIRSGEDIAHLRTLDQKLWVALACPTRGIEFDPRTLDLIDLDHDVRIRPPELIEACEWACHHLRDPDELVRGGETLEIDAIDTSHDSGRELADEARRIVALLERDSPNTITLEDVHDQNKLLAAMRFNGDGIVTVKTAEDEALAKVIQQIIDTQGPINDRNGEPGIDQARADAFFAQALQLDAWRRHALDEPDVLPLGDATRAAYDALAAVRDKIDDYFARGRVAAYDERAAPALNPTLDEYRALAAHILDLDAPDIAALPLAPIASGRVAVLALPLEGDQLNPAWANAMRMLRERAVLPLMGDAATLTEHGWDMLKARFDAHRAWLAQRPASSLDRLDIDTIAPLLASGAQDAINSLIAEDKGAEPGNSRIVDLEKLLRLKRDLLKLLNNFVSFKDFYRREGAAFQAGTLYLDARSCDLTVRVADAAKHATLAGMAKACLAYCECTREGEKMTIVAAFTAGDVDFLFVGRNGIFYDRQGKDWDATIVKLIDNPISVWQAFMSPYKKFVRMIEEQVAKRAAASDTVMQGRLSTLATGLANADKTPDAGATATPAATPAVTPTRANGRIDVGTVAALGVALGSISAVAVGIFGKFIELGWWIPVALIGIVLAISGPSMLIAWLKLRERSLGPILDASGWAINGRMRINVKLGGSLSQTATIPPNGKRRLNDPFADRHTTFYTLLIVCLVLGLAFGAWRMHLLDSVLPAALHFPLALHWPSGR